MHKKLYTVIHVIGLSIGLCFALLILVFIWQELQVNRNLKNAERQYILTSKWKDPAMGVNFTSLAPLSKSLKEKYPNLVANYFRWDGINSIVSVGTSNFREGIKIVDESLLTMFGFKLLHGSPKTAFKEPFSVVLPKSSALKYFGSTDAIGKTISIQNFAKETHLFKVTGVLAQPSDNSVIKLNEIDENDIFVRKQDASFFDRMNFDNWENPYYASFIEIQPNTKIEYLDQAIESLLKNHTSETTQNNLKVIPIPLMEYYLQKDNSRVKRMLYFLGVIGTFILLMAIVNFINISISYSGKRTREIGIRKVLGSTKQQLIIQFLIESITLAGIATVLACCAYIPMRPLFSATVGKELISVAQMPIIFFFVPLALSFTLGIIAGLYPSFILASFNSVESLKGKLHTKLRNSVLQKCLIGFQYAITLIVLINALIISDQMNHFFSQNLGYNKEFVLTASVPRDWSDKGVQQMKTIRDEFKKISSVRNVSLSYVIPDGGAGFTIPSYKSGEDPKQITTALGLVIDSSYLKTFEIPLLAGNTFLPSDGNSEKVLINRAAMESYGINDPLAAVGQQIVIPGEDDPLTILGVTENFNFESMHQEIKPQLFLNVDSVTTYRYLVFKLEPNSVGNSLSSIERVWKQMMPDAPFEYKLMNETLENLYTKEIQTEKAARLATFLMLIIALLGVFGMVALSIDMRNKEVGIRKVLGASVGKIIFLFLKEFLVILLIAIAIASPIAYWLMQNWLQNYTSQIEIGVGSFLIAILIVVIMTTLLILLQTSKVAFNSPVKSLRTE